MKLRSLAALALLVLVAVALLASCGPKGPSNESTSTPSNYGESDSATMASAAKAAADSMMHAAAVANGQHRNSEGGSTPATPAATPPPTGAAATPAPTGATAAAGGGGQSKFDSGPRAADQPVNAALAAQGKTLFTSKGCVACHAFGRKVVGPDLKGVAKDRAAEWMTQQIMHPEVMVKSDPISMQLLAQYKVPMTNQKVSADEAKALVEFIKSNK